MGVELRGSWSLVQLGTQPKKAENTALRPVYTRTGQSGDHATAQSRLPYMVKWVGLDGGRSSLELEAFDQVSEHQ